MNFRTTVLTNFILTPLLTIATVWLIDGSTKWRDRATHTDERSVSPVNVKRFGAKGDSTVDGPDGTDDTKPIQTAIDTVSKTGGGTVWFPRGVYRTSAALNVPRNVELRGEGGKGDSQNSHALGSTVIRGKHSHHAVVSLVGANGCRLTGIGIYGDSVITPQTGVLCGRVADLGSAGHHTFHDVVVSGYFTATAVAEVSSENNIWDSSVVSLVGGGAHIAFFTSQSPHLPSGKIRDLSAVVHGGTNLNHTYRGISILNYVNDSKAVGFYNDVGSISGAHTFFGCWSAMMNGAHVYIRVGTVDGKDCPGPISFFGWNGESLNNGQANSGFRISSGTAARTLSGLTIDSCRITLPEGAKFIRFERAVVLKDSRIEVPSSTVASDFVASGWENVSMNLGGSTRSLVGNQTIEGTLTAGGEKLLVGEPSTNSAMHARIGGRANGGAIEFGYNANRNDGRYLALGVWDNDQKFVESARITVSGLTVVGDTQPLISSTVSLTNHAAVETATLTNAPRNGQPTKWIRIDDAGTPRYIPAW